MLNLAGSSSDRAAADRLINIETAADGRDILGGSFASVTSGAAVLLIAAPGLAYQNRTYEIRVETGDVYLADDAGVAESNGMLVKAGETFTLEKFVGPVYAIAVSTTATVRYGICSRS